MANIYYEVNGATRVGNALRTLATQHRKKTDVVVGKWAKRTRTVLKGTKYPNQTNKPQPFKSDRQRRFFFWALSQGLISVPYRRTGRLASSWSAKKVSWGSWRIENSRPYSELVIGKSQARYHKGNWWKADDIIGKEFSKLTKELTKELVSLGP